MEWSKVKNILIAFLLLVNLALGGMLFFREHAAGAVSRKENEEIAALLRQRGISLQVSQLSPSTVYSYDLVREPETERLAAEVFVGLSAMEDLNGSMWLFRGEYGTGTFRFNGQFDIAFSEPRDITRIDGWLTSLQGIMGITFTDSEASSAPHSGVVAVRPLFDGLPFWNGELRFIIEEGKVTKVEGRCPSGSRSLAQASPCKSAGAAMLELARELYPDKDGEDTLISIELGFNGLAQSAVMRLTPVWKIELESGGYFVNAYTHEIETFDGF